MMAVWVVVVVVGLAVVAVAVAARRHADDVEPSVREFTEFRDAISRQVLGLQSDTRAARAHREPVARHASADASRGEHRS